MWWGVIEFNTPLVDRDLCNNIMCVCVCECVYVREVYNRLKGSNSFLAYSKYCKREVVLNIY